MSVEADVTRIQRKDNYLGWYLFQTDINLVWHDIKATIKLLTDYSEVRVAGKYTKVFSDENMEQVRHKHEKSSSKIIVVRGN